MEGPVFDVVIVGGGPAGSTAAALLRKYNPSLSVLVLEKERFPRPHIGESQLPAISPILWEMGVWDKVEAAGFPIKLGASLTWGRDAESWDFDFFPVERFRDEARPARYEGQRQYTAFQVERAIYDDILLRHAESLGARVREEVKVARVEHEGDRITALQLDGGERIRGRHYLDASGTVGLFRRELGIESHAPAELRNIALWDYWENAEWAVRIGVGGTRIQIRSLPYGWLWFIPMGPTRTSIGLVCPAEYYKSRALPPAELYEQAVRAHPGIAALTSGATPRGRVETTRDWSHVAERIAGQNWLLAGEAAGFADPILSAGMTLAHTSARDAAYTILELERGEHDPGWLRRRYDDKNRANIQQHIRFALYWYASNACFTDLKEHCARIARDSGLRLSPEQAWGWLAQGGFTNQHPGLAQFGSFDVASAKHLVGKFIGGTVAYSFSKSNIFRLNLLGAAHDAIGHLHEGRILKVECYRRGPKVLPLVGCYANIVQILKLTRDGVTILNSLRRSIEQQIAPEHHDAMLSDHMQALDAMVADGWVLAKLDPRRPLVQAAPGGGRSIRSSTEGERALHQRDRAAQGA